jgi:hypothetical protein
MSNFSAIIATAITLGLITACGLISTKFLGDDNSVEEAAEAIIKDITCVEIDLSPESPESK